MLLYLLMAVVCGFVGYAIDRERGLALGAVFGVLGLLIAAILVTREPVVNNSEEENK